ncbi:hypothetical protein KPH14_001935 [Odynerus spinipes]|uniref:Cytochrome P450 n=1 Tax=Odynerus spinipes TaxID=1348599 RepID=A0AAD9S0D2_9HYME|nr:hypothetical protein KPH14_001935 [Odynerus spinipes]
MTIGWILSELFGALFLVVSCAYLYYKLIVFNFWRKKGVPYEEPSFPIGNINETVFDRKSIGEVFQDIYEKNKSRHYIGESGVALNKFLEKKIRNENEIEIKEIFACFFTDIIVSTAFGINSNCLENPDSEFRYWGKKVFEPRPLTNMLVAFAPKVLEFFSIPFTQTGVTKFFLKAFEDTVNYRKANQIVRRDFMDLIIQLMNNGYVEADEDKRHDSANNNSKNIETLTTLEAAAQAYVFYLAGFETTSSTVTHCLYELALNQDVQTKLREEIDTVVKKHGDVTYNCINDMTYLHMVVIPEGTSVIIPVLGIHRDPNIYPEPDKFIPERFTEEKIKARHPYEYLPFGEGPRICIGMRFGWIQTKIALVNVLSKFKFVPGPKTQNKLEFEAGSFVLMAKGGIHLRVESR